MSNRGKHCECGEPKDSKDRCCPKCRAIESDGNRKAGPPVMVVNGRRRTDYNRNTGMAHKDWSFYVEPPIAGIGESFALFCKQHNL